MFPNVPPGKLESTLRVWSQAIDGRRVCLGVHRASNVPADCLLGIDCDRVTNEEPA